MECTNWTLSHGHVFHTHTFPWVTSTFVSPRALYHTRPYLVVWNLRGPSAMVPHLLQSFALLQSSEGVGCLLQSFSRLMVAAESFDVIGARAQPLVCLLPEVLSSFKPYSQVRGERLFGVPKGVLRGIYLEVEIPNTLKDKRFRFVQSIARCLEREWCASCSCVRVLGVCVMICVLTSGSRRLYLCLKCQNWCKLQK